MPHLTKWPATVREFGDMAAERGLGIVAMWDELEREFGPIPMPPAGYTLAHGSSDRWIGDEVINRRWIITPAWYASTDSHSIEVWMADHQAPTYGDLTPAEARELGAALIQAAQAAEAGE